MCVCLFVFVCLISLPKINAKHNLHIRALACACLRWERIWNGTFCSSWLHTSSVHLSAPPRSAATEPSITTVLPCMEIRGKNFIWHHVACQPWLPGSFCVRPHIRPFTRLFVPVPRCSQKMLIYLNLFKWRWVAWKCREISQSSRSANTRAVPPHSPPIRPHRQLILTTGGQVCLRKTGGEPRNGSIIF